MKQDAPTTNAEQILSDLDGGVFAEKLGRAMSDVARNVTNTGKKGEVVVKFNFKQIGESNQVQCDHTIKYLMPTQRGKVTEENTTATPLHVGANGKLTLFPETQQKLFEDKPAQTDA